MVKSVAVFAYTLSAILLSIVLFHALRKIHPLDIKEIIAGKLRKTLSK